MSAQRVELPLYSLFSSTPVYNIDNVLVFGLLRDPVVPDPSDDLYLVNPGETDRLDLIAAKACGTTRLWWAIARVNNVIDPEIPFDVRQQIRLPTRTRLAALGVLAV